MASKIANMPEAWLNYRSPLMSRILIRRSGKSNHVNQKSLESLIS